MTKYAKGTTVSPNRSLEEIQNLLQRYGATGFGFIMQNGTISIGFEMENRRFRFTIHTPGLEQYRRKRVNGSRVEVDRSKEEMIKAQQQAINERWRALVLVIKAKLESVESGIESIEEAFMAQLVLPNGQTVSEWAEPQIKQAYLLGKMPPMLMSGQ